MKKLRKKNQLILTLLAVMIAVAGYLTYLPPKDKEAVAVGGQQDAALMDISDEDVLAENVAREQAQYSTEQETQAVSSGKDGSVSSAATGEGESSSSETDSVQPGEAVLSWSEQVENVMAKAQLAREQVRERNEETLNNIINNKNLSEKQRQTAADNLMSMTENAGKEANIEAILETKGISQALVTISDTGVEVLVGSKSITSAQRAQIEDTVKREADVEISDIVISLMNGVNTEVVEEP